MDPSSEWVLQAKVDRLSDYVHDQQARLDALAREHALLAEDFDAMLGCLQDACLLRSDTFLAKRHRQNFARMCARHPCTWLGTLEHVVETRERTYMLAELTGGRALSTLATCSRVFSRHIGWVAPGLAATLPPMVYVVGGEDDDGQALCDVERLNPLTGIWEAAPPLRVPRKWCGATALAGHVYVVGGWDAEDDTLDAVDRFDPWSGVWEVMPPMQQRRGAVAAASSTGTIFAMGGQDGTLVHDSAEVLDVAAGVWLGLPAMRCARHAAGAAQLGGAIYIVGGCGSADEALGSVEVYDPYRGAWVEGPALRTPRAGLATAALGCCVYAAGGRDAAGHDLCSLERLDPRVAAWEFLAPLTVPRWGLGAAACGHRLYALGGTSGIEDASVGACERYTPEQTSAERTPRGGRGGTENWAFVGCLRLPRRLFGAASSR